MNPTLPDALAHCLATEGKTRPLEVAGLGMFHVRAYGEGAKHKAGVLFLASRELRNALAGAGEDDANEDDGEDDPQSLIADAAKTPLSFSEWLARTSQKGEPWAEKELAALVVEVRRALLGGKELDFPALGRFTTKRMAPMTVHSEDGDQRHSPPRIAACFSPSDALRRRLER
jgi:hypothetical protein